MLAFCQGGCLQSPGEDQRSLVSQRVVALWPPPPAASLFNPKHLLFDQVTATFACEGDLINPGFFDRDERLGQQSYRRFFASKKCGSDLDTSADYTFDKGTHTLHQAAFAKLPQIKVVD